MQNVKYDEKCKKMKKLRSLVKPCLHTLEKSNCIKRCRMLNPIQVLLELEEMLSSLKFSIFKPVCLSF